VKSALHDKKHESKEDEDRDQRVERDRGSSQPPASGQDVRARETEPAQEELPGGETQPSFVWSTRFGGHETGLPVAIALDEEEQFTDAIELPVRVDASSGTSTGLRQAQRVPTRLASRCPTNSPDGTERLSSVVTTSSTLSASRAPVVHL
jgi:hypothetical protein